MGRVARALAAVALLASFGVAVPARAAFPGANGRLVFERELPAGDHTQSDLFVMRADGSGFDRLTATPQRNEFGPAWNAAGTRLAFWRTHAPFGPGSIWVMAADGRNQRRITTGFDARDPAWSPDGKRIVFTRTAGGNFDLWTMRASDGGDQRRLTSGAALDFEPGWSPGGDAVAFTRGFEQGDAGDVYVLDLASRRVTRITHTVAYDHQVAWGPGGKRLVFERDYDTSSALFVARASGGHVVRLTHGGFFDTGPAWSPGGTLVAFGSDRGGALLDDLWLVRTNGTHLQRVHELSGSESFPDWRPLPS